MEENKNKTSNDLQVQTKENTDTKKRQYFYVIRELTKREIKRKYARSYLGVIWSVLDPLLHMVVVTFIFSYIFSRDIENYPAYYFVGYIVFNLFITGTSTAMTSLKDNRGLMLRTRLPRSTFVLSRVYTALVNFGFSCIAFVFVLIFYRIHITWTVLLFPIDLVFLLLFTIGVSYALSIWFVFQPDAKNIYGHICSVIRFFVALFYSADNMLGGVKTFIQFNPAYSYIKIARDCILYGRVSEPQYWIQIVAWGIGFYLLGTLIFRLNENNVVERL